MDKVNLDLDELDELKSVLGLSNYDDKIREVLGEDGVNQNFIYSAYCLIGIILFKLDLLNNQDLALDIVPKEFSRKIINADHLFNNFSEFLQFEECKDIKFQVNEKSPSSFLFILDNKQPEEIKQNITLDYSNDYSKGLKDNFSVKAETTNNTTFKDKNRWNNNQNYTDNRVRNYKHHKSENNNNKNKEDKQTPVSGDYKQNNYQNKNRNFTNKNKQDVAVKYVAKNVDELFKSDDIEVVQVPLDDKKKKNSYKLPDYNNDYTDHTNGNFYNNRKNNNHSNGYGGKFKNKKGY